MKIWQTRWFQINSTIVLVCILIIVMAWYGNAIKPQAAEKSSVKVSTGTTTEVLYLTKDELIARYQSKFIEDQQKIDRLVKLNSEFAEQCKSKVVPL